MKRVKKLTEQQGQEVNISSFPNFHKSGSVTGMRDKYYGKDSLLVRCGEYIYNVTSEPSIYDKAI